MHTAGMHNAKVPHDDRCRDRIVELTAEDDDQIRDELSAKSTELEGTWRLDGTWIDPKLLDDVPKEEMEYLSVRSCRSGGSATTTVAILSRCGWTG